MHKLHYLPLLCERGKNRNELLLIVFVMKNKIYLRGKVMEKKLIKCEIRTKNDLIVECELKPDTIRLLKKSYNLSVYEK